MNKKYEKMAKDLSEAGRFGDTRILHVNEAELAGLGSLLPSGELPTNPKTGQPEAFGFLPILIGMGIGAISGGVTAKSKNIPLWQGILQGAAIGGATSVVTAGLGSVLGGGAGGAGGAAGAQAGTEAVTASTVDAAAQATADAASNTLTDQIAQSVVTPVDASIDAGMNELTGSLAQSSLDNALASNPALQIPTGPPTPLALDPNPGLSSNLPSSTGPLNPTQVPTAPPPGGPPIPADGPINVSNEVIPYDAADFDAVASALGEEVPSTFMEEQFGEAARAQAREFASNPINLLSPAMMTEALLPTEWDEENYLAGYEGPYDKSWTTGPGVSWAARDGGEVRRRSSSEEKKERSYDSPLLDRINRLSSIAHRIANPTAPGRYNPLSDEPVQFKIRPSANPSGMHRVGVTLPFNQGGLASLRRS